MPHVIVKLASGRSDSQKATIADAIAAAIVATTGVDLDAVSVAIEDVAQEDWVERVYRPDILPNMDRLFRKPGYDPL